MSTSLILVRGLLLSILLGLGGCTLSNSVPDKGVDLEVPAQALSTLVSELEPLQLTQLVEVSYQGQSNNLLFMVESEPGSLRMLVLTPLSVPVVSLHQNQSGLTRKMHLPISLPIPAQAIIRDYLLATLGSDQLTQHLAPLGIRIQEQDGQRLISQSRDQQLQPLLQITSIQQRENPFRLLIEHLGLGYRLQVQTLGAQPL